MGKISASLVLKKWVKTAKTQEAIQLKTVDFEQKLLWLWWKLALTGSVPSESTFPFCIFISQNKNMIPLELMETLSNYTFCNIWYYVLSIGILVVNKTIIKQLHCFSRYVWGRTLTSGLYYKHITIVIDAPSVISKWCSKSLMIVIDDAS
jgi:hypothetical protein